MSEITPDVDWKSIPTARFSKWQGDWYVVADVDEQLFVGDKLEIERVSGGLAYVVLKENVPYATSTGKQRWLFDSVTRDNEAYGLSERFGESSIRDDVAADGKPSAWSRNIDGSVHWPRDREIWRMRGTDRLGMIKRGGGRQNAKQAGWYEFGAERGQWFYVSIIMDDFEFIAKNKEALSGTD